MDKFYFLVLLNLQSVQVKGFIKMKKLISLIVVSGLFFTCSSFAVESAGESLRQTCARHGPGKMRENVRIVKYNYNTITNKFNTLTDASGLTWSTAPWNQTMLFDMVKTARLTGEKVNICVDETSPGGPYLLGIEWAESAG
ncbi:hypothetical protein NG99_20060 [Erwinia typographi]|uniref:Uncharacterized protein n=1 Tax=Erwinia typographi TaxID=371042 RepID=A0A0A3ZU11_9GAMM|nr:hypothetical protein [Erwinia typographi]KGT89128.1 hypothetical protein NG99_20060 [Erwinia typographi]